MFLKEYKLIFDIPEKPLDRIFQVIKSIKESGTYFGNPSKRII